jgi:hypothetical protein
VRYFDSLGEAGYPISEPCSTMPCSFDEHLARGSRGGVDFAVGVGSPIPAPTKGRVRNWSNSSAGNAVDFFHIDDSGNETGFYDQFMHLRDGGFVSPGVYEPGATIGFSGNTGSSTGPHIHWDLVNPQGKVVRQWEYFTSDEKPESDMIYVRNMQSGANYGFVYLVGQEYVHVVSPAEVGGTNLLYGAPVDFKTFSSLVTTLGAFNIPADVVPGLKVGQTWSRDLLIQQLIEKGGGGGATPAAIAKAVNDDVAKRMGS